MKDQTIPVLFVDCYPQAFAGQQHTLTSLLTRAASAGIQPHIGTPSEGIFVEHLRQLGHTVDVIDQPESINAYGGAIYRHGPIRKLHMLRQVSRYIWCLRQYIISNQFQVIFCNDMRGLLTFGIAARLAGRPVIIWDKLDRPHGLYDHLQLLIATRNLVIAERVTMKYPSWQNRVLSNKIAVVPDGIAWRSYLKSRRTDERDKLGIAADTIVLAIIGTVTPRKGHDLLFTALKIARQDLHLLVIGEPDEASVDFAESLRAQSSPNIHWLGQRSDLSSLLAEIDIVVSPSRFEGMGRVNVEAMAAGLPVIGAKDTGISEVVVDGETGILLDPKNTQNFAEAINSLASSQTLRAQMGKAGQERARTKFDLDCQVDRVLNEITALAGVRP